LKRLGVAVLAGMLSCSPVFALAQSAATLPPSTAASPVPSEDANVVRATLGNGMHVILLRNRLAPVATTLMTYGVGSVDDTMPGIAHATEHMLFRGTETLSAGQLGDIAARMGAEYNAFTADQFTLYYYKLPSSYVDLALHIEADRMTHAAIRAADWATERGAIEQEIRAQESQPAHKVSTALRETFFAGMPYAKASGGTVPSFEKMTADDIRAFYKTWYKPGNATLIVAGDIDPQRTLAAIHREFDANPPGDVPAHAAVDVKPLASSNLDAAIDFPLGFGALAYRMPGSNDPEFAASEVLRQVFASGRTAFADLTAQGKILGFLDVANAYPEVGVNFLVAIPARDATPQSAQALMAGVLEQYRKDGLPTELIEAAKTRLLSEQAYSRSSISGMGLAWAAASIVSRTPDELYAAIAKVTPDDVNALLRKDLSADHQLSIVITAKPTGAVPKVDPSAGVEHVGFTPTTREPLPVWAQVALKAPLRAPADTGTVAKRLPNGLKFAARRETAAPTVVVSGVIRNNPLLYVPKGKDGLATIVDDLMPFGTTTYDRKAYEAQVDAIAANVALGTSFALKVQAKDFERGMELLADGMLHPAFAPASFTVVKGNVLQSVAVSAKLPRTKAELAQRLALYQASDPRRRVASERTVASATLDDAKRYYRSTYRPDETTIAVVGDVAPARVENALRTYFGGWKAQGAPPTFVFPKLPERALKAQTVTVKSASSAQSEVTLKQVFAMRRGDPDYVPLLLANTILSGEGSGSLLYEELRTHRGYVYSTDSDFDVGPTGAEFSISFASDPKNVARANAAVVAIVKRLQSRPLSAVELQRAKALLLAQRVLPLDSYAGVANDMVVNAKNGVDSLSERWFWEALLRTTPAQLQHALRRIDADHFLRIIVEPQA
jgi:zinc protease